MFSVANQSSPVWVVDDLTGLVQLLVSVSECQSVA